MSLFEFAKSCFNLALLVGRKFVAKILQTFLCLENHSIGLINLVDALLLLSISSSIGTCFIFHALYFSITQTA